MTPGTAGPARQLAGGPCIIIMIRTAGSSGKVLPTAPCCGNMCTCTASRWRCWNTKPNPAGIFTSPTTWAPRSSWWTPKGPWSGRQRICPTAKPKCSRPQCRTTCASPASTSTPRQACTTIGTDTIVQRQGDILPLIPLAWRAG